MGSNLYIAASGAVSRMRQLEVVANNLANANSTAFKADRALFHTALESAASVQGRQTPGAPASVYVRTGEVRSDHTRGAIQSTGVHLDAAIDGPGFFVVETPEGERFTRAGSLVVGPQGYLMTRDGQKVLGEAGPITITKQDTRIQKNGDLVYFVKGKPRVSGTLRLVEFEDPSVLAKEGNGLFRAPDGVAPKKVDSPSLIENSLEGSNVTPAVELAVMMMLQRAFDASIQAMQAEDGATERLIEEVSR